jgi:hypothetical protein
MKKQILLICFILAPISSFAEPISTHDLSKEEIRAPRDVGGHVDETMNWTEACQPEIRICLQELGTQTSAPQVLTCLHSKKSVNPTHQCRVSIND